MNNLKSKVVLCYLLAMVKKKQKQKGVLSLRSITNLAVPLGIYPHN